MARGYFGIGIYQPKKDVNIGSLWRSAHAFGASFIFTIGRRYHRQPSDTTNATVHVPYLEYQTFDELKANRPFGCQIIGVELDDMSVDLPNYNHPVNAIYLLGSEDNGLPVSVMEQLDGVVHIPWGQWCLNVSVAGSIVIYDRLTKQKR